MHNFHKLEYTYDKVENILLALFRNLANKKSIED